MLEELDRLHDKLVELEGIVDNNRKYLYKMNDDTRKMIHNLRVENYELKVQLIKLRKSCKSA